MIEKEYEIINKKLVDYLNTVLAEYPEIPVLDFIEEFAFANNLDLEMVGDVIRDNPVISNLVRVELSGSTVLDEW